MAARARCFAHLPVARADGRAIGSRTTASRVRSAIRSPTRISERLRASRAATSSRRPARPAPRPMFGPFQIERGVDDDHAVGDRLSADRGAARPAVRAVRDMPHARHQGARSKGEVIGELPEQMPFHEWKHSAFAGEQRSCQSCHMPVVEEETPICVGSRRAAQGLCAPHVCRRQFLHAAHAEPISGRSGSDGTASMRWTQRFARRSTNLQTATARIFVDRADDFERPLLADVRVRESDRT